MAQLDNEFDANEVPEADPFEVLPDNTVVTVVLDKSERKMTKDGEGEYIAMEFVVVEGPYESRRFFENLNLWNKNEKAVAIAKRMLSSLSHAAGVLKFSDTEELHGRPVLAKLGTEPARNGYDARNKIKTFLPVGGEIVATETSTADAASTSTAPAARAAQLWGRKA